VSSSARDDPVLVRAARPAVDRKGDCFIDSAGEDGDADKAEDETTHEALQYG
jgi:hypothetical protein